MTHKGPISVPKIALYEPDIPQNTAAIIRTCSCLGAILEIIEPKIDGFGDIPGIGVLFAEDSPETLNPGESADLVGYVEVNDYAIAGMNIIKLILNDESPEIEDEATTDDE